MGKKRYEIIDEEKYLKHSIHDFNRTIESINSLKARTPKETLELKLQSIQRLPRLVFNDGIRYKRCYSRKTAEVWYKEIQ
mgnify:CR=1 FL=1